MSEIEKTIEDTSLEEWNLSFAVNVTGTFLTSKYALPLMRKAAKNKVSASIINFGSYDGFIADPGLAVYCATKGAVHALTRAMACDHGSEGIRVNAICPGTIKGDRMKRVIRDKAKFEKVSAKTIENDFVSMASMRSWINPEDIGNMCAHLISDEANKVSGQVIAVDGNCERMD